MWSEEWKIQMIPFISNFRNKRNLCCGVTLIVLNAIAWPSFLVWVLIDVGLAFVLIVPRVLQLTKKTSRVDSTTSGDVKRGRGDFSSAMSEALNGHLRNSEGSRRIRPGSRHNYNHDFSRCTPDERDTRTPLPTISAIRNRLSYSAAEASIRSVTPAAFNPNTYTLKQRNHNLPRSAHWNYTPNETTSSSVLHIARTNLPVTREACSPVVVKVAPLGTSPRIDLAVEAKHDGNTCSKEVVVNALKQITQKRKRVYPLADSRDDDDSSFLDSLPTLKKSRQEPAAQQAMKRTWTKVITNENLSKAPMPDTKKHKTSSNVTEGPSSSIQLESMIVPSPAKTAQAEESNTTKDKQETTITTPLIDKEVTQTLDTSDKENKSLDTENEISNEQKVIAPSGILKKLRTVYPSSKPSVDAMRRKFPILCSSGLAPKLGRQSSKLKYEDYVKDREDVYAKVKRVLEEVDEAELQKKKKEEKPKVTISSEPAGMPSDAVKCTLVSMVPQLTNTVTASAPLQSVVVTSATTELPTYSAAASTCSTVAPPPNVVISSTMSQIIPTTASSLGQQLSVVLPVAAPVKPTSTQPVASSTVTSSSLAVPKLSSHVGTTSSAFNFTLPTVKSTASSSSSQVKQPTLSFSMPASTTPSSSLKVGTVLGTSSSLGNGLTLPLSSGAGLQLQLPTTSAANALGTSSSLANGLGLPPSLGAGLGLPPSLGAGLKLQLPTTSAAAASTTNTVQLQANLLHNTNTLVSNAGQTSTLFGTSKTGSSINFSFTDKPSVIATATATAGSGSLFTSSAGSMEVASAPQQNFMLNPTFNKNPSIPSNQPSVTSAQNFASLFASNATTGSLGNSVIASSTSGSQFGNIFGNPQTTRINPATNPTTTTSGQPFIFNIFQSSHTTAAPSQFGGQLSQSNNNVIVSSTPSLSNQPLTQASNVGFNFMAKATSNIPNFTFNLQPSISNANASSLFTAPPGGFNVPSSATTAQPKRRTARSKPKRK